jgi:hypothetical protein
VFRLFGHGFNLLFPFFMHLRQWLDTLLVDESPPSAPEKKKKKGQLGWIDIIIIVALIYICVVVVLTLSGPSMGRDHSDVIKNL